MPRPKKQTTVDHEKLMVVAQHAPDLLTREELLQVATGAITPAPKQRRKRRKRRKKRTVKAAKKATKKKATKRKSVPTDGLIATRTGVV